MNESENKTMKECFQFLKALKEAQKTGSHEFTCPLCGGVAEWERSMYNNHLRAECDGCGISIVE